jgi:hypothetical protein
MKEFFCSIDKLSQGCDSRFWLYTVVHIINEKLEIKDRLVLDKLLRDWKVKQKRMLLKNV